MEFILNGVNQNPDCGGINMAIGITDYVGYLTRTIVRNDANNNGRGVSSVQEAKKNILARGSIREGRR